MVSGFGYIVTPVGSLLVPFASSRTNAKRLPGFTPDAAEVGKLMLPGAYTITTCSEPESTNTVFAHTPWCHMHSDGIGA